MIQALCCALVRHELQQCMVNQGPMNFLWVYSFISVSGGRMSAVNAILQHSCLCCCVLGILGISVHSCGPGQFLAEPAFLWAFGFDTTIGNTAGLRVPLLSLLCSLYSLTGQIWRRNNETAVSLVALWWCLKNCLDSFFLSRLKQRFFCFFVRLPEAQIIDLWLFCTTCLFYLQV